jgi:two-component system chemotaxis sensor kinase CheA
MLRVVVNSYGIDATCVRSAAEAWPQIKAKSFDLYMLDGWLPTVDGYEFCRQIREFDPNTPILFYSGAAYEADKRRGIDAGANAYVTKPDVEELIETMLDLIAKLRAPHVAARWVSNQLLPPAKSLSVQCFSVKSATN